MTPDGRYVGKNGEYEKNSNSSSGGSSGSSSSSGVYVEPISAKAITTTAQYYGKEFNTDGLIITVYKYGVRYKVIKLPDPSITIRKISVNGKENGLLRSEQNKIDVEFIYYDTDVIIGQTMKTTLNVLTTNIDYSSSDYWYQTEYGDDKIDVFYILWTVIFDSTDETGKKVYYATLSDAQKTVFDGAFNYSKQIMFTPDKFNIIAPYYRQLTMNSFSAQMELTEELPILKIVLKDVFDAFDYYMEHKNNGRPFIVAGFSQGGLLTPFVINHMTEEQYSRLIAGYSMGFQLTAKQLANSRIKPAEGEDDLGVIISYNSVENTGAIWPAVAGKAATCINPLNWKTDTTSAELTTEYGDKGTVYIDKSKNVLLVKGLDNVKYGGQNYDGTIYAMPPGNYHMWEMRFFANQIKNNALLRAQKYKDAHP